MPDIAPSAILSSALRDWNRALQGPLARALAMGNPGTIGWPVLSAAIEQGVWRLSPADIQDNALLSLLANQPLLDKDPITNPHHSGMTPPAEDALQALCLLLVEKGCSPTDPVAGLEGITALDLAVMHNMHQVVQRHGSAQWQAARTIDGLPWLHVAARTGCLETMEVLMGQGVDPNARAPDGTTALFHASCPAIVQALRRRGADPAILDSEQLDASSYWRTRRSATGERLVEMKRALGTIAPSPESAVPQFLALVEKCTASQIKKEARRLKIKGNERHNGKSVVSALIDRIVQDLLSVSLSDGPFRRVEHLAQWNTALEQATPHELGVLAACATITGQLDTRTGILGRIPKNQHDEVVCNAWLDVLPRIAMQQARRQSIAKSILLSDLSFSSQARILVAVFHEDCSYPSSDLLGKFASLPATTSDPGWRQPGFAALLVRLATCPTSISSNGYETVEAKAQQRLRDVIMDKAREGIDFPHDVVDRLPKAQAPHVAEFVGHLVALSAANGLDRGTQAPRAASRGTRL